MKLYKKKCFKVLIAIFISYWVWFILNINYPLFSTPYSTIIEDENSELLGAKIANDGQWRFPNLDTIPYKFEKAILHFEDEYFYYHLGVNPISILRAIKQNFNHKKVKSGASTITMQTIRLSRQNKARTYSEKNYRITFSNWSIINLIKKVYFKTIL